MDGKKRILAILGAIWAALIAYNAYNLGFFTKPAQKTVMRAAKEDLRQGRTPELRLDLLERPKPAWKGVKKDIFSPLKARAGRAEKVAVMPVPAEPSPAQPRSALKVFASEARFIGFLETGERTLFISRGQDLFLIKRHDLIDGRFRVTEITGSTLTLVDESNNEQASVPLENPPTF